MTDERSERPAERLSEAVRRFGRGAVVDRCVGLLVGQVAEDEPVGPDLAWLGGEPGTQHLRRLASGDPEPDYWSRVWAARGLLHVWDAAAAPAVLVGLADEAWRVREMCAKVAHRHQVGAAAGQLARLAGDEVPRVRAASARALGVVGEHEDLGTVQGLASDSDPLVVDAAVRAAARLAERLDLAT